MNKYKKLTTKLVKLGITAAVAVTLSVAAYVGATMLTSGVAKKKTDAQSKFSSDQNLLNTLKDQMSKSGEAEKRFAELQEKRIAESYETSSQELIEYLKDAKTRYKFLKFEMSNPPKEVVSDKPELANFSHHAMTRPLKFQITAVSDLHIFSFIDEMRASVPGIIRVDVLSLKRTGEITESAISGLATGSNPILVDAKIELTWITIVPKERNAQTTDNTSAKTNP